MLYANLKDQDKHGNLIINLKKQAENIVLLIKNWCKKKLVFSDSLIPFGTVGEANAHCTHLQITQANHRPKFAKEYNFAFAQSYKLTIFDEEQIILNE